MTLIDTNILARFLLGDIADHSERCRALFQKAAEGKVHLYVPATCVAEITWLLIRQRSVPKSIVAELLLDLFQIRNITVENSAAVANSLRLMVEENGLSFVDCYHLALAEELGMTQIYSFDKKMGRQPGIERVEPELTSEGQ